MPKKIPIMLCISAFNLAKFLIMMFKFQLGPAVLNNPMDPRRILFSFLRFHLFIFKERGREGEREGEKYQCMFTSHMPPTGDLV